MSVLQDPGGLHRTGAIRPITKGSIAANRVLVVDGTGRGHAICRLFTRTNPDVVVYYGPGCDVIDEDRVVLVPSICLTDPGTALEFLSTNPAEFVFVSHIDALSCGYVDALRDAGHAVIGPTRDAATLETSKARGKQFCVDNGIPTAPFRTFTDPAAAQEYVRSLPYDCVVKTDSLTPNGDGSIVCDSREEGLRAIERFAGAGDPRVVIEQRLYGQEISIFALLDGQTAMLMPAALDFKRSMEGDGGPNCDGMGSISPHPLAGTLPDELIRRTILEPVVRGLRADKRDYTGFLYIGAMVTAEGLHVLELNARFGDSEAQVVLPGIRSDFSALCRAIFRGELREHRLDTDGLTRCSVALVQGSIAAADPEAAPGWPFGPFEAGQQVSGLDESVVDGLERYYGNLRRSADGSPVTSGGRVLHVVGAGVTLDEARIRAYEEVARISFAGMRFRRDIGLANADGCDTLVRTIESVESTVRSYSRCFPAIFASAKDDLLVTQGGRVFLDFLSGAGTVNYGHNRPTLKQALISYLGADGLTHGLDLFTTAKADFLDAFSRHILAPRGLPYRVQFCGPSGTNAVEAALKLARLSTYRQTIVAFSGGFHGVSTGSLAATSAAFYRQGVQPTLSNVTHIPFPQSPLGTFDSLDLLRRMVADRSSGYEKPAAVLVEPVQGEGGVWVAPTLFLQELRQFCDEHAITLIVDEIQSGCGRTGSFFSFERAGIVPDLVTLSKGISGFGLPMSVLLIKPEHDVWQPGQHNGTFRGNQLAFVTAAAAIREFWCDGIDGAFAHSVRRKSSIVEKHLREANLARLGLAVRGIGLIWGIDATGAANISMGKVSRRCFDEGLIVETCGRTGEVLKILPPLTISDDNLVRGLHIITSALGQ